MENKLFSIGEISKIKGISKKALRFYERIGLLKPCYINPRNRYRYYSIEQFVFIDIIKAMRGMGISPNDIKAVLKRKDTGELMDFLAAQKEKTGRKIIELRKIIGTMSGVQDMVSHSVSSLSHTDIYFRKLLQRNMVTLEFKSALSTEDAIIEFSKFDRIIQEHQLINAYETGILYKPVGNSYFPSLLFNTVSFDENSDPSITSTLPAGDYVCVCSHKGNTSEQAIKIAAYCSEKALVPAFLLQVELLTDIFSTDSNYSEFQMLVQVDH